MGLGLGLGLGFPVAAPQPFPSASIHALPSLRTPPPPIRTETLPDAPGGYVKAVCYVFDAAPAGKGAAKAKAKAKVNDIC